ncbi:MAG: molybdenum cofactor guanylyltransferase [Candidatus Aminicenantes bacterium]|nr:molybdenum cofactor guanylyltransferase [Candidatus Aminicenantes bacterium]
MMKGLMKKFLCRGRPMTLVVLAGGRSRRMGQDKALLPVPGGVLLGRTIASLAGFFDEVVVSVSTPPRTSGLEGPVLSSARGARVVIAVDAVRRQGPLRGILTGLRAARNEASFVLAGDMPDVSLAAARSVIRKSDFVDCAVAVGTSGLVEPLFGVYKRTCIPAIEDLLAAGRRSVLDLFAVIRTAEVALGLGLMPPNINTPDEYRAYLKKAARPQGINRLKVLGNGIEQKPAEDLRAEKKGQGRPEGRTGRRRLEDR